METGHRSFYRENTSTLNAGRECGKRINKELKYERSVKMSKKIINNKVPRCSEDREVAECHTQEGMQPGKR